jgi:uncharacterized membrane protein
LAAEAYLWFKSLHIIGVIVWFAGLFYLVRLFIYHEESKNLDNELKIAFNKQYTLMEKKAGKYNHNTRDDISFKYGYMHGYYATKLVK